MKKVILSLLVPLVLVIVLGFQEQDFSDREAMIKARVSERVEDYRRSLKKRCRDKVMKEAGTRVDSILIARSEEIYTVDSIPRPVKPVKPIKPEVPLLDKTEPIAPVVGKENNE